MEIFELGIMREVKEVQLANAPHSILSIVDGIAMDFKEWQSEKRWSPIIFMDSDNTALSNEVHIQYLQPIITQYFASNKSEIWP